MEFIVKGIKDKFKKLEAGDKILIQRYKGKNTFFSLKGNEKELLHLSFIDSEIGNVLKDGIELISTISDIKEEENEIEILLELNEEPKLVDNSKMVIEESDSITDELEYLFNDKCIKMIDDSIKGRKFELIFSLVNGNITCSYENEVVAVSSIERHMEDMELKGVKYSINATSIGVEIPKEIINSKTISDLDDIKILAREMDYDLEKIDYLNKCNVPVCLIKMLLDNIKTRERVKSNLKTLFIDDGIKVKASLIKILSGGSIRLFGPKSCGKNTLADTLIWLLESKVYKFSSNPQADKGDLVGETGLTTVIDSKGNTHVVTKFQERVLTKAMKEGAILLLDEINTNDSGLLSVLHGPLDDSKSLSTQDGIVKAENGFCVIATMNEGYVGTEKLNPALVDRMLGIEFEMPKDISEVIKLKRPDVKDNLLEYINIIYSKIVKLIADELCDDSPFSIRGFIDVVDLVKYGFKKEEAVAMAIINRIQDVEYREVVKSSLEIC